MALPDFFTRGHTAVRGKRGLRISAAGTVPLPKGVMLDKIYIRNRTAQAVTGGIKVGTTNGGTDVLAAGAVAANAVVRYDPLISAYNANASTIYIDAVTSWNSATVDVVITFTEITTRTEPSSNVTDAESYK